MRGKPSSHTLKAELQEQRVATKWNQDAFAENQISL
jgi:hypothetical protein